MKLFRCVLPLMILALLTMCSRPVDLTLHYLYGKGDVTAAGSRVEVGYAVKNTDTLATGAKSFGVIQSGTGVLLLMMPETQLSIATAKNRVTIDIRKGGCWVRTLHEKVRVGFTAEELSGEGDNASFLLLRRGAAVDVRVADGMVTVKGKSAQDTVAVHAQFMVQSVDGVLLSASPMSYELKTELMVYREIVPAADIRSRDSYGIPVPWKMEQSIMSHNEESLGESFQMKRLEMKYGALNTVVLKNGKSHSGAVRVTGPVMTVITPKGEVKFSQKDVKTITRYLYK